MQYLINNNCIIEIISKFILISERLYNLPIASSSDKNFKIKTFPDSSIEV